MTAWRCGCAFENTMAHDEIECLINQRDNLQPATHETLRDRFAMAALPVCVEEFWGGHKSMAECAYKIADAMLATRKGERPSSCRARRKDGSCALMDVYGNCGCDR